MANLKRLSVDSDSWKKNSHWIKVNRSNDSFELPNGIQLFTWSAGLRECGKIGKTMADLDYLVHPVYSSLFEPSGYVNGIFDRPGIAENPHVAYCWSWERERESADTSWYVRRSENGKMEPGVKHRIFAMQVFYSEN